MSKTFVCWNLEKRDLIDWILSSEGNVDCALFQEYDASFPIKAVRIDGYTNVSSLSFDTYGTCILTSPRERIQRACGVKSPHADFRAKFWKGMVNKCTQVVTLADGMTVVSFHGYNGTLQGRNPSMLVDHIQAVMKEIPSTGPCVFAGDFNTFTDEHHKAVKEVMERLEFKCAIQIPYDDSKTLDLVYTRRCQAHVIRSDHHLSDHPFIVFKVTDYT